MSIRNLLFNAVASSTLGIVDIFNDGSGKALYRLDGNTLDESGNYNGTATSITYGTGQFGQCAVFNGTTSQIVVPTISPTMKSISFWASRDVVEASYCAIYGGADDSWFGFGSTSTAMRVSINAGVGINLNLLSAISANIIYHFVLVWESATSVKLYRDGVLQSTTTVSAYQTTAITYIGRRNSTLYHKGKLDQLRIFNRALTAGEVSTLNIET